MSRSNVEITRGYQPSVIKAAVDMQSRYYTRTPGFSNDYETHLASRLAEVEARIRNSRCEVWAAKFEDKVIGTIFIDTEDAGQDHARLTSFVVDDGFRGTGVGRRLLTEAINFVDEHEFAETQLWTFEGSDAARRLYETVGFVLEKQFEGEYFGKQLMVQFFVRKRQSVIPP